MHLALTFCVSTLRTCIQLALPPLAPAPRNPRRLHQLIRASHLKCQVGTIADFWHPTRIPAHDRDQPASHLQVLLSTSRRPASPTGRKLEPAAYAGLGDPEVFRGLRQRSLALRSQAEAILACDFFTAALLGGTQAHALAVTGHATRRIHILGVTLHPTGQWTAQQARNLLMDPASKHTINEYRLVA